MELYEVEATRWYFSEVFYRVVAKDESDAFQQAHKMEKGVVETSATAPESSTFAGNQAREKPKTAGSSSSMRSFIVPLILLNPTHIWDQRVTCDQIG